MGGSKGYAHHTSTCVSCANFILVVEYNVAAVAAAERVQD